MTPAELTAALQGWLAPQAESGAFAGVVLVARDGKVLFERAYGTADRERGTPTSTDLRFSLASIGKAFTRVGIGQLVQQGKLRFSDTLGSVLPGLSRIRRRAGRRSSSSSPNRRDRRLLRGRVRRGPEGPLPRPTRTTSPSSRRSRCIFAPGTRNQVLQRLLHRPRRDHREEFHGAAIRALHSGSRLHAGRDEDGGIPVGRGCGVAQPYTRRRGDGDIPVGAVGMHGVRGSAAGGAFARPADLLAFDQAVRSERCSTRC